MSASAVSRGNPYSRAARAPIRTNSTRCLRSVRINRSGSNGATGATLDTLRSSYKPAHLGNFTKTLVRGQSQNTRHVIEDLPINDGNLLQFRSQLVARGPKQARQRLPRWY